MKVYAMDVDDTIEGFNGPVTLQSMRELREQGHIVGLCGNTSEFCKRVENWHQIISFTLNIDLSKFLGGLMPKEWWLWSFQNMVFPKAEEYIMVGNVFGVTNSLGFVGGSHDSEAATRAGWRFIREDDFANGQR